MQWSRFVALLMNQLHQSWHGASEYGRKGNAGKIGLPREQFPDVQPANQLSENQNMGPGD